MDKEKMMSFEDVDQLYKFLKGEDDLGFTFKDEDYLPKLTDEQAFRIIYVLQERFRTIPDTIEKCDCCGGLFDTECEGYVCEDGFKACDAAPCFIEFSRHEEEMLKDTVKCDFCGEEYPRIMGYSNPEAEIKCCGKSACYRKFVNILETEMY